MVTSSSSTRAAGQKSSPQSRALCVAASSVAVVVLLFGLSYSHSETPPAAPDLGEASLRQHRSNERNVFGEEPLDGMQPAYHVAPRVNWLNDPNGCELSDGQYRVAYQHNPTGPKWGDISWGVATSRDLVTWHRQPTILTTPRPEYETLGAWSGNVLDEEFLVYSCARALSGRGKTTDLCLADRHTGERYAHNPVLRAPEFARGDWRDPCPFHFGGKTYLLIGSTNERNEAVVVAVERRSRVEFAHVETPFFQLSSELIDDDYPRMFECPDVVQLSDEVYGLKLSVGPPKGYDVLIVGTVSDDSGAPVFKPFPLLKNKPESDVRCADLTPVKGQKALGKVVTLDCGGAYAAQSIKVLPASDQQQNYFFGWSSDQKGLAYNGALTLPRVLTLDSKKTLRYTFAPELAKLRSGESVDGHDDGDDDCALDLPRAWGNRFEVEWVVKVKYSTNHDEDEQAEPTRLRIRDTDNHVQLEASLDFTNRHKRLIAYLSTGRCQMRAVVSEYDDADDLLTVRLFADGSLFEWDLHDGLSACATRSYGHRKATLATLAVETPSSDAGVRCHSLRAWRIGGGASSSSSSPSSESS